MLTEQMIVSLLQSNSELEVLVLNQGNSCACRDSVSFTFTDHLLRLLSYSCRDIRVVNLQINSMFSADTITKFINKTPKLEQLKLFLTPLLQIIAPGYDAWYRNETFEYCMRLNIGPSVCFTGGLRSDFIKQIITTHKNNYPIYAIHFDHCSVINTEFISNIASKWKDSLCEFSLMSCQGGFNFKGLHFSTFFSSFF
jgi:hypothetical protein